MALNLYRDFVSGNPSFNEMVLLGEAKQLRDYYKGRYRNKHLALLQAEYRIALFQNIEKAGWKWLKRFKIAVFSVLFQCFKHLDISIFMKMACYLR